MLQLLSAPGTLTTATPAHRFIVDLTSDDLDFEGVPINFKTIDVLVAEPSKVAIEAAIATDDSLNGYSVKSFCLPEDGCTEF